MVEERPWGTGFARETGFTSFTRSRFRPDLSSGGGLCAGRAPWDPRPVPEMRQWDLGFEPAGQEEAATVAAGARGSRPLAPP